MNQKLQPPRDVPASDLFRKLLETPSPSEVIDFPRKGPDGKPIDRIRIVALGQAEHDKARETAFEKVKARSYSSEDMKHISLREVVGDMVAKELIAAACFTVAENGQDAQTGQPIYGRIFHSGEDVGFLRPGELTVLFNAYMLIQDKYGPLEHNVDIDAWVKRLTEGGQAFPLLSLDLPDLVNLTSSLAARISTTFHVLESQWSQLPSTCQSDLERFGLGTGYWLRPLDESEETSTDDYDIDTVDAIELGIKIKAQERIRDSLDLED